MECDDNDKDSLTQTFAALTLAANDHANASGDMEKGQIAMKLTELLLEIQRMLARCSSAVISSAFTPAICESWFVQLSRMPTTGEQFDLTRDIIKICLAAVVPEMFFRQYSAGVTACLVDPKTLSEVKEFIMKEISQIIDRANLETIGQLGNTVECRNLLTAVTSCLSDNVTSVSESAGKCLAAVCRRQPVGVPMLFSCELVVKRLQSMVSATEIVRFRLFEFIGAVSIIDAACLQLCADRGFVNAVLKEVDSDDLLCQLNAMEILTEMAAPKSGSDHCLRYFRDHGFLQKLNGMLLHAQEAPDATFLFPAVIKFFGHLSRLYPKECCEGFPLFLSCVFDLVINYNRLDVGQRLLAFDTLGLIGSTPDGKLVLGKRDDAMKKCVFCFGNSFKQGPLELRARHIEAFGSLIELKESDQTEELLALTERWFSWLERSGLKGDACKLFFDLFRQPFPEIHIVAGQVLKKLAAQSWGRKLMAQQAGFLEYLLNRTTENTMEGRYIKYEIVKSLVDAPSVAEAFDAPDLLLLKEYVQEGPFYVKAQAPDVAFEEA